MCDAILSAARELNLRPPHVMLSPMSSRQKPGMDEIISGMRKARLCPIPTGDMCSGRRFFNAIATGCVPVLTASCFKLPFRDVVDYASFTFSVPDDATKKHWIALIQEATEPVLRAKRSAMKLHLHRLMYNWPTPRQGDAFYTTMERLRAHWEASPPLTLDPLVH